MAEAPSIAEPDIDLARRLFRRLEEKTRQGAGIVRDSYGAGEEAGHDLAREAAAELGLEIAEDSARNLYMTLPGRDRDAPGIVVGSHLDSVPQGGNFDGAAGVVAGLAVLAGLRRAGHVPPCDLTAMATRGEESAWFDVPYIGSHAAFGLLSASDLEVRRSDDGRSLADHMAAAGCDLAAVRRGEAYLDPARLRGFLEVHIEQGPLLVERRLPLGLVTGIRGCLRYRDARCYGQYGHSGALPRAYRRDAVAATVALIQGLNEEWLRQERAGRDLVFTVGELMTDSAHHGPSKIAGETRFVLDFRSTDEATMREMGAAAEVLARDIEQQSGVTFALGKASYCEPAVMDSRIRATLVSLAEALDLPAVEMASGAGHDAAVFTGRGVPCGMIFIRNENGSHNPAERMDLEDFAKAARLLSAFLLRGLPER